MPMPSSIAAACGANSPSGASSRCWSSCWRSRGAAFMLAPKAGLTPGGNAIARIKIQGLIRGNQERVEALERLGKSNARAVIVHLDSPGGTTAGSEQLYDALRTLAGQEADGGGGRRAGRLRRLYRGAVGRAHHRARYVAGRLDRRAVPVSEFHRGAENHRHQGRGDQILAAQGRAERLRADQPGGARGHRGDRARLLCLVQRPGEEPPPARRRPTGEGRRRPRVHRPPGRAAEAGRRTRQRKDRAGLAGQGQRRSRPTRRCAITRWNRASASFPSCMSRPGASRRSGFRPLPQRIEAWGGVQAVERLNLDGLLALWHPSPSN